MSFAHRRVITGSLQIRGLMFRETRGLRVAGDIGSLGLCGIEA